MSDWITKTLKRLFKATSANRSIWMLPLLLFLQKCEDRVNKMNTVAFADPNPDSQVLFWIENNFV